MNAIIALNPGQMQEAQATTLAWVDAKIAGARADVEAAESTVSTLRAYGLKPDTAEGQLNKAAKRVRFYRKVRAALALGYYIVPPFPLQLFAIRTDLAQPPAERSTASWMREATARSLPEGMGRWVDPRPEDRVKVGTQTETRYLGGDKTEQHQVAVYRNTVWRDELELPHLALKPQIIEAVGKALEAKVFDALGIAPAYRSADPIICGQIKRPSGGVLTFFVAWWLDEADL